MTTPATPRPSAFAPPSGHFSRNAPPTPSGPAAGTAKRVIDVALAAVLLAFAVPFVIAAAGLVRATSRGPAIYSQTRLGRGGVPFTIYKIRTMANECERDTGPRWCAAGDPRVTPVGRVLRRLHIDELPQLVNVLRGDMSLVGPRPERPLIAANLGVRIPDFAARLAVRPGVTGLAQVQFPPDTDVESARRKLAADLGYIHGVTPGLDVRILICTILHVLHLPRAWRRLVLGRFAAPPGSTRLPLKGSDGTFAPQQA